MYSFHRGSVGSGHCGPFVGLFLLPTLFCLQGFVTATDPDSSIFVSLEFSGLHCHAKVRSSHAVDTSPPHPWHVLPFNLPELATFHNSLESPFWDSNVPIPFSVSHPPEAYKQRRLVAIVPSRGTKITEAARKPHDHHQQQQRPPPASTQAHMFFDPRYQLSHGMHGHQDGEGYDDTNNHHRRHRHPEPVADELRLMEAEVEFVWFPAGTRQFRVYCGNLSSFVTLNLPQMHESRERYLRSLADATGIDVQTEIAVGPPTTQLNIVFLSGGFLAEEKAAFAANVTALTQLLNDPSLDPVNNLVQDATQPLKNMHRSVPHNRYLPFWNIYSVFQPSNERGASRPLTGLRVDNNLKCTHPSQIERAVFCDRDLSMALADTSPARPSKNPDRTLIFTLVNTPIYGGSGVFIPGKLHLGTFFNSFDLSDTFLRQKMLSLMNHEIGHAMGNLVDEYPTGAGVEPTDKPLSNCQKGSSAGPPSIPRWQHWISLAQATPNFEEVHGGGVVSDPGVPWGIAAVPEPVCSFDNYYKPAKHCMMQKLDNWFMCPVCREQSALAEMAVGFRLSWPRQPLLDTVIIVPTAAAAAAAAAAAVLSTPISPSSSTNSSTTTLMTTTLTQLVLHLPAVLTPANGYSVTFYDVDGEVIPLTEKRECPVCAVLTSRNFAKYPINRTIRVTAVIEDRTVFISKAKRDAASSQLKEQLNQTTYFQVRVVDVSPTALINVSLVQQDLSSLLFRKVGRHDFDRLSHYVECPLVNGTPGLCSLKFNATVYEAPNTFADELAALETWVFVAVGGIALLFLFLWVFAANNYTKRSHGVVRPIFKTEFSCFISLIRRVMMLSAVVFMIASIGTIGVATYYYTKTSALGKIIIFTGLALAFALYIMAFVGFWSVSSRSKRMLLVNGGVLFIGFAILVSICLLITYIANDLRKIRVTPGTTNVNGTVDTLVENDQGYWVEKIHEGWKSTVENFPERACAIQGMLDCSGFNTACNTVVGSSLECPRDCDKTNERYIIPCRNVIRGYIVDNYDTVVLIVGASAGLIFGAIVFNFVYYCSLLRMKAALQKRVTGRANARESDRSSGRGGGGAAASNDRALFILRSLGDDDTASLIREFKRIDTDGNGEIDRAECFNFFRKALVYKPTNAEIDLIFEVADVDKSGTISASEFLALFGHSGHTRSSTRGNASEEELRNSHNAEIVRKRMVERFGTNDKGSGAIPSQNRGQQPPVPRQEKRENPQQGLLHEGYLQRTAPNASLDAGTVAVKIPSGPSTAAGSPSPSSAAPTVPAENGGPRRAVLRPMQRRFTTQSSVDDLL